MKISTITQNVPLPFNKNWPWPKMEIGEYVQVALESDDKPSTVISSVYHYSKSNHGAGKKFTVRTLNANKSKLGVWRLK